jgi:2-polyprenyl-3-methyl-5-hydroxy-6-metoxy-1,4-benzoquinol methylase
MRVPKDELLNMSNFNRGADSWDTPPRIKLAENIAGAISKEISLASSMNVLDFGCGTGLLSQAIHGKVHSITCIDTAQGMIDVLKTKIASQGIANINAQCIDYLSAEDTLEHDFDLVMTAMALHHIQDVASYIERFYGSLVPGGYIAIADLDEEGGMFHRDNEDVFHFGFSREGLKEMLSGVGFEQLHDVTAAEVTRPDRTGAVNTFSIFLLTGRKEEAV